MREDVKFEGALFAKQHGGDKSKWKKKKGQEAHSSGSASTNNSSKKKELQEQISSLSSLQQGHPPFKCWRRPDAKCSKCNQLGHVTVICKWKTQHQQ